MSNPAPDVIQVSGSPCLVVKAMPELRRVVSRAPLGVDCLKGPVDRFTWGGAEHLVYAVPQK